MSDPKKNARADSRLLRALRPLGVALLAVVCISGIFIYPFLFSAASFSDAVGNLASRLLITALVVLAAALVPAILMSFTRDDFSISLTFIVSLTAAVFFSWITMFILQISPLGGIGSFSGAVLNVMLTALIGAVLSILPALLSTAVCVLRRIIAGLLAQRRR